MSEQLIRTIEIKAIHSFDQASANERTGLHQEDERAFSFGFASGFIEALRLVEQKQKAERGDV